MRKNRRAVIMGVFWEGTIGKVVNWGDLFGLLRIQYISVVGFVWDALHWGLAVMVHWDEIND